jgi:NADH-quinone oxidoreductase subunit A
MLFVMFDIELIFIYPYAVDRQFLGTYGFVEMLAVSVVFFGAFVYVVARGALDWGPAKRDRRLDGAVSPERTLGTTIRRVGTEGRIDETTAA